MTVVVRGHTWDGDGKTRHSYAAAALAAGISPKIVSERLEHSSVAFTPGVHTHMIPELDRQAADDLAALIRQARHRGDPGRRSGGHIR